MPLQSAIIESMKSKIYALVAVSALTAFVVWQCYAWPVVEMETHWVEASEIETYLASRAPIERPPTAPEVVLRGIICGASILLGTAIVCGFRSSRAWKNRLDPHEDC
jgi:hypothetical protein